NEMLERLLKKLAVQETKDLFEFNVVVVDNDPTGPGREMVLRLAVELGLNISYDVEPVQSIPAARNHALRLAVGDYVAIIDDDEFPPPDWLITMYHAIRTFEVDGAFGPVYPYFDKQPPAWLLRGRFSGAPAFPTGTPLHWRQTYTGNVLFERNILD